MRPLYQIQSDLFSLISRLESTDDCLEYELLMIEIDKLEMDKTQKLNGCCAYVKHLRVEIEAIANEITRLKERMLKAQKAESKFLDYLRMVLPLNEGFKSPLHTIAWRKSEAVEVTESSKIPPQYMRQKISYEPDKETAKQDMKMGAVIPGFQLVSRNNLVIK